MQLLRTCLLFSSLLGYSLVSGQSLNQEYRSADDPSGWVLNNIYRIRSGNLDSAKYYLELTTEDFEEREDNASAAQAYKERGIVHYYMGKYDLELADLQAALKLANLTNNNALKGDILKELALTAKRQGDLEASKGYGTQAIRLCELANDESCLSSAQRNLGRLYLQTGPRDSAVYFLKASYALKRKLQDSIGITYGLNDMAELAAAQQDYDNAIQFLRESAAIREALSDSTGLAISINNIGEMYFLQGDLKEAQAAFEESLSLSTALKYLNLQQHTLSMLGKVYTQQGNYKAAYDNLKLSTVLNDSLYSVEKANAIAELETQFDTERKEQTIRAQAAAIRAQRLGGTALVLGLLLIGSFVYYRLYQRRKYEREIAALSLERELHLERERISRDLHDSVGANLTRIITDIDLLKLYNTQSSPDASSKIKDMRQFARQTISLLRETIWALHKEEFTVAELTNRINQFLSGYLQDRVEWKAEQSSEGDFMLNSVQALNILRILQEATQNMLKHANASFYQVLLEGTSEQLTIVIHDNGKGMNNDEASTGDHYGIKNMKHRAAAIKADFEMSSSVQKGTSIKISLSETRGTGLLSK